jgi:hypothetical protein
MPYYKEKDILFIHIPKTGGTNIEDNLKKKITQTLCDQTTPNKNNLLPGPYDRVSPQHLDYSTIYKFREKLNVSFDNIKVFSVVRNPYNRIISDLLWGNHIKSIYTADMVYDVIKNQYLYKNDVDNHNLPQYTFVTDEKGELIENIRIFKTEELNDKNDEINKYLGVDINIIKKQNDNEYQKFLNKKSIDLINEFYKKDFELFNYELKL